MKTYKIIKFSLTISILGIFFLLSKSNVDIASQARNLYIQTGDSEYLILSSQIMYHFQIQLLIVSFIVFSISYMFDIFFKYEKYRINRIIFLVLASLLTSYVASYLFSQTENDSIRFHANLYIFMYLLIVVSIGYFFDSLMKKREKVTSHIDVSCL